MESSERVDGEQLNRRLNEHLETVRGIVQLLNQNPPSSVEKISWDEVIKIGEQISQHATTFGILWAGEEPEAKAVDENMAQYVNLLKGILLISHGCADGAGPTLLSSIRASVKLVLKCSFTLLKVAASSEGTHVSDKRRAVPQLVGTVWEACSALKKTPTSNITAIGRAMTQVAVSMKDVLREIKELKPAEDEATSEAAETSQQSSARIETTDSYDSDNSCGGGDLGNDLSPEEMEIAQLAAGVVSETLSVIKELIRSITGLLRRENQDSGNGLVDDLEKLLKLCQDISLQVDELGAFLYPPQEIAAIKAGCERISGIVDEMKGVLKNLSGSSDSFGRVCANLKVLMKQMVLKLNCPASADDLGQRLENLDMSSER